MQRVKSLGDAGKLDQADALLDKILSQLQAAETGAPAKNKSSAPAASVPAKSTGSPVAASAPAAAGMSEIALAGAPDHGTFDPSVASDGAGKLFMSLSGVASTVPGGGIAANAVRTYLAASGDQGKSWRLAGVINPDIGVTLGKAPTNGRWQSEVSALVFDPAAPVQARWKLVWHQYLNIAGERKFAHGWLAYKEAATAAGLAAAKPVKLFTAAAYDAVNDSPTGWTRSPIAGPGVNKVQQLAPALGTCIAVSEAGLLSKPDALYMSQVCFKASEAGIVNDIAVLKCARPCNAAAPGAWSYAGTALTAADAQAMGLNKFSASDLFTHGGKDYVTVSPEGKTPVDGAYKGCAVFRFANIASAKAERGANGLPVPATAIATDKDSFNGACSFLPSGPNQGLVIGRVEFFVRDKKPDAIFHIFNTNTGP